MFYAYTFCCFKIKHHQMTGNMITPNDWIEWPMNLLFWWKSDVLFLPWSNVYLFQQFCHKTETSLKYSVDLSKHRLSPITNRVILVVRSFFNSKTGRHWKAGHFGWNLKRGIYIMGRGIYLLGTSVIHTKCPVSCSLRFKKIFTSFVCFTRRISLSRRHPSE